MKKTRIHSAMKSLLFNLEIHHLAKKGSTSHFKSNFGIPLILFVVFSIHRIKIISYSICQLFDNLKS